MNLTLQAISLVGAGLILVAYVALQRNRWTSRNRWYLWCNLLGSVALTVVAVSDRRVGFVLLEATWAVVSLWSMIKRPDARASGGA